jgi:hypothetical protein
MSPNSPSEPHLNQSKFAKDTSKSAKVSHVIEYVATYTLPAISKRLSIAILARLCYQAFLDMPILDDKASPNFCSFNTIFIRGAT